MLDYTRYLDKVYGCWLGKCIVGTVGAPYEGMKQLLHLEFDEKMIAAMLPNDDLVLQVLWLSVLEEKGIYTTGEDLAAAFSEKNIYWPGEYAWFKRNYDRGIRPPYTALYENDFYIEGMGCPIRAEIWGLIVPGNPALAAKLCVMDGTLDHAGNSVYFEQFWAAMVAQAFVESDLNKLIACGLRHIPAESRAAQLIRDVVRWCAASDDIVYLRSRIIAEYGHCDCTNAFQNIGITLMLLLKFSGDVRRGAIAACNCGFDTDCTAGNFGALCGLLYGAKELEEKAGFRDSGYVLTLYYRRETDRVADLARDTARIGLHFMNRHPDAVNILTGVPEGLEPVIAYRPAAVRLTDDYEAPPYLAPGETVSVRFTLETDGEEEAFRLTAEEKEGFTVCLSDTVVRAAKGRPAVFTARVRMNPDIAVVNEVNRFAVRAESARGGASRTFGVVGKTVYRMFGPFWENNREVSLETCGDSYQSAFYTDDAQTFADELRFYHLNMRTDPARDYMDLKDLSEERRDPRCYERNAREVYAKGDVFSVRELTPFRGPCTLYLKRTIRMSEDREYRVHIGHSDAYRLYLNGVLVSERTGVENWTPENVHLIPLRLKKGDNELIFRVCNRNGGDRYSVTFLEPRDCPPHAADLNSVRKEVTE